MSTHGQEPPPDSGPDPRDAVVVKSPGSASVSASGPDVGPDAPAPRRISLPHRVFRAPDSIPGGESPGSSSPSSSSSGLRRWFPALRPGEPETCRRDLRRFLAVFATLSAMLVLAHVYRLEGRAFRALLAVAAAALPIHYWAPFAWKKPLFTAISTAGLFVVFGWTAGLWIAGFAAALIGICASPLPWGAKAGSAAAIGAGLLWLRGADWASAGIPATLWPILGSMFMFRIIIYLYEIKHSPRRESLADTANYFVLLPNFCFVHFPVVDYRNLQRGYFQTDIHSIQHVGLRMTFRGMIHLLLYRLVYHELLIAPERVSDPGSLAAFLVCNYLLYLRVSGQFHIACGLLHLFGYKLPETHHNYLLAESFTDYWRRINIYWKDFMVRIVFNPTVFRLKRLPQWQALAAATVAVFVATWFLHGYQSYWIRGAWGFSVPDALFWGILGALVVVNVQWDARRVRKARRASGWRAPAGRSLRVAATFVTIATLWSLWSSESLAAWLDMMARGLMISGR